MDGSGVKDTTAYKIIRQMTDHIWGSDEELEDEDVVAICRLFTHRGGLWQSLMDGAMNDAIRLEKAIESVVKYRQVASIAARVATRRVG